MGSIKFETNLGKLTTDIKRRVTKYERNVADAINTAGLNIESDAKLRLQQHEQKKSFPGIPDAKRVKSRVSRDFTGGEEPTAVVESKELPLGAYLEFGTGKYAREYLQSRPIEEREKAYEFYETGRGTIKEFPYLFPSFDEERPRLIKRIRSAKI